MYKTASFNKSSHYIGILLLVHSESVSQPPYFLGFVLCKADYNCNPAQYGMALLPNNIYQPIA